MTYRLSASHNIDKVSRELGIDARKYPAVISATLSGVAFQGRREAQESAKRELDRPTRYSLNAILYKRSTTRSLESAVFVHPNNNYLHRVVYGGIRRDPGRQIFIPAKRLRTTASGNISRPRRRRLLSSKDTKSIQGAGLKTLIHRKGGRTEFVGIVVKATTYRTGGYWKFHESALKSFDRYHDRIFRREYAKRIKGSRRR